MLKEADREMSNFNEVRMNLIKKYGEKDDKGELVTNDEGNCKILADGLEAFTKELNELTQMEVEINANKFSIDDLENLNFTPTEMVMLEPFIEEE